MVPFRATGRSNRSGRVTAENDVFEGLPVRQWRQQESVFGPQITTETVIDNGYAFPELPMPREANLLAPHTQALLRAARKPRFPKPKTDRDDDKQNDGNDTAADTVDTSWGSIRKWTQISRDQEEPEPEYLAKRRKGLPVLTGDAVPVLAPDAITRTTKIRRTLENETTVIYQVILAPDQRLPEEIPDAENVTDNEIKFLVPGTVIDGVGIANAHGALISNELLQPRQRKRPPIPQKKRKGGPGRGKKKVMFQPTAQSFAAPAATATAVPIPAANGAPVRPSLLNEGETAGTPLSDAAVGAEDDGDVEGEGAMEGEGDDEEDDGDDDEEGNAEEGEIDEDQYDFDDRADGDDGDGYEDGYDGVRDADMDEDLEAGEIYEADTAMDTPPPVKPLAPVIPDLSLPPKPPTAVPLGAVVAPPASSSLPGKPVVVEPASVIPGIPAATTEQTATGNTEDMPTPGLDHDKTLSGAEAIETAEPIASEKVAQDMTQPIAETRPKSPAEQEVRSAHLSGDIPASTEPQVSNVEGLESAATASDQTPAIQHVLETAPIARTISNDEPSQDMATLATEPMEMVQTPTEPPTTLKKHDIGASATLPGLDLAQTETDQKETADPAPDVSDQVPGLTTSNEPIETASSTDDGAALTVNSLVKGTVTENDTASKNDSQDPKPSDGGADTSSKGAPEVTEAVQSDATATATATAHEVVAADTNVADAVSQDTHPAQDQ